MVYYYAENHRPVGPLEEDEFRRALADGKIDPETLVWREDMTDWQPYGGCRQRFADAGFEAFEPAVPPRVDEASFERPTRPAAELEFAGFWIRGAAFFLDSLVLLTAHLILTSVLEQFVPLTDPMNLSPEQLGALLALAAVEMGISCLYETWFVGRFGATPGKMACRLKVVFADGSPIGYGWAFGRFVGKFLSRLTLGIGFVIAAFDAEKRALHDLMCNTRVVKE